ncbi:MAG: family 78 glycoside hydrolase catalytic domain, partial [Bacteroidota bacterium]
LWVQLEYTYENGKTLNLSDSTWKVHPDSSWDNEAPKINRFQQIVVDRVDLRKQLKDWTSQTYDDHNWPSAQMLMRNVAWPLPPQNAKAIPLTPPWTSLQVRDLPYLEEQKIRDFRLIQARALRKEELNQIQIDAYQDGDFNLEDKTIQKSQEVRDYFLLLDFGQVMNVIPHLKLKGPRGTKVEVLYAPFIVDDQFSSQIVDSDFRDEIILSGDQDSWEATYFKPGRYLGIIIHELQAELKFEEIFIRNQTYPFQVKGKISAKEVPWIEAYMEASERTLRACTTDAYTDNYRERRQYAQTGYYAALGNYYVFGDTYLQRRYLLQIAQEQEANGIMPAYAPLASDDFMIILDANCLWLRGLWTYYVYSGDEETLRELLPAARKLILLLGSYTNEWGMIADPPYPYWLDHAQVDRRGANFVLNAHYLGALEDFAQVLAFLDEEGANMYKEKATFLRKNLREKLWDSERKLFSDALLEDDKLSKNFTEHSNGMALALRIANKEQAQHIAEELLREDSLTYIFRESGMTMVTPAMSYFLHKGLCEYGYVKESFELFRQRFDKMLHENTNQSLWEEWWLDATGRNGKKIPKSRSDAQTESAFPPVLFAEYLLGVKPIAPAMSEVLIKKPVSYLAEIIGKIPSPSGSLHISWDQRNSMLKLEVPEGMNLRLDLLSFGGADKLKFLEGKGHLVTENSALLPQGFYEIKYTE